MLHLSEGFLYITSHSLFLPATTTRYRFCIIIFIPYNKTRAGVPASIKNIQTFRLTNFDERAAKSNNFSSLGKRSKVTHERELKNETTFGRDSMSSSKVPPTFTTFVQTTTTNVNVNVNAAQQYHHSDECAKFRHESNLLHQRPNQRRKRSSWG